MNRALLCLASAGLLACCGGCQVIASKAGSKAIDIARGPKHNVIVIQPLAGFGEIGPVSLDPVENAVEGLPAPTSLLTREIRARLLAAADASGRPIRIGGQVVHYEPAGRSSDPEIVVKITAWDADKRLLGVAHVVGRARGGMHGGDEDLSKAVAVGVSRWLDLPD